MWTTVNAVAHSAEGKDGGIETSMRNKAADYVPSYASGLKQKAEALFKYAVYVW